MVAVKSLRSARRTARQHVCCSLLPTGRDCPQTTWGEIYISAARFQQRNCGIREILGTTNIIQETQAKPTKIGNIIWKKWKGISYQLNVHSITNGRDEVTEVDQDNDRETILDSHKRPVTTFTYNVIHHEDETDFTLCTQ
jgi:hypothetical protein